MQKLVIGLWVLFTYVSVAYTLFFLSRREFDKKEHAVYFSASWPAFVVAFFLLALCAGLDEVFKQNRKK